MQLPDGLGLMAGRTRRATSQEVNNGLATDRNRAYLDEGLFAGTIGVRRLLKMFAKYNIKTTWFIPGHSLDTFPEECAMIRDAGHEM